MLSKLLVTILILFAVIGIVATVISVREFYIIGKYEAQYIENCPKVKIGMPIEKAMKIMGGENYLYNEKSFQFYTSFENGKPRKFSIDYPTSSSSMHTEISFDPLTGLVIQVDCSGF